MISSKEDRMCPSRNGLSKWIGGFDDPSRLVQAFNVLDSDGDGTIRASDLILFFTSCVGQPVTQEEVESMIAMADLDGNGAVDLREFQCLMTEGICDYASKLERPENNALRGMFQVLDLNNDGLLSLEDLRAAMNLSGQPTSDQEIDAMIAEAGGSRKASIDFDSFSRLMARFC